MTPFRFFFRFTKDQQKGILALFIAILLFQFVYFIVSNIDFTSQKEKSAQEKEWLAHQSEIDALRKKKKGHKDTIYPFNPNYISDYKGYLLGLSVQQIDKLHAFRESGKYVNTAADFKSVTGVHDTVLAKISPYFKFGNFQAKAKHPSSPQNNISANAVTTGTAIKVIDINDALEEDLVKVYGIGPYYAKVILRRRSALGGFVNMAQMDDFAEFSTEAKAGLKKNFAVLQKPEVEKINVNTASLLQLSRFPYFNRDIAKSIITERSMSGKLTKIDDLLKITGFPVDKEKIIALYLEF